MGLFEKKNTGVDRKGILSNFSVDVIKWEPETGDSASVLVHKFEAEDFPSGSQLIVHPSQIAVFINNLTAGNSLYEQDQESGKTQIATFVGPCRIKLETGDSRFAPFRNIAHSLTGGESAYHSSVYFINTTYMNELTWGTRAPVVVVDPEEEINVHVRAFGFFGVHIEHTDESAAILQAGKFLRKVVGTRADYTQEELVSFMRAKILEYVPDMLAKSIIEKQISVLKISAYLSQFSQEMQKSLSPYFDDFGLTLDNFSFNSINVPEEDLAAINEMKIQKKRDRLEAEGAAVKMDIESAARARMREREGYTYQQEQSFQVLHAAAENQGTGSGLMGAGIGLGMGVGVGSAFGANMNEMAKNLSQPGGPATASDKASIICPQCKTVLANSAKFCFNCGAKIQQEACCPSCGEKIIPGAKFCYNCGMKFIKTCPNCGAELQGDAKFCIECGTKL